MSNQLARPAVVQAKNLNPEQYLLSLLQAAYYAEKLSRNDLDRIQMQIMDVLKETIIRYTAGESSSVREETAQNLMLSVLYCLDVYCRSIESPEDCLDELKAAGIQAIYHKGVDLVVSMLKNAKEKYVDVLASRLDTPLIAYNDTIDKALPQFFRDYNVFFHAHDTMGDIDYPLACDDTEAQGVCYILQYLEKLALENDFCRLFSGNDMHRLLVSYGRVYRIDYPEYLLNLFEIVLTNAVFSVMLGKGARLSITKDECSFLFERLKGQSPEEIAFTLSRAAGILAAELAIGDAKMKEYMQQTVKTLAARVHSAVERGGLDNIMITDRTASREPATPVLNQGKSMDNKAFRLLVEEILACRDADTKAGVILAGVQSLTDFVDLLEAECLFGEEYRTLFALLGELELAMLITIAFAEEIRDHRLNLSEAHTLALSAETEWAVQLASFLSGMDSEQLDEIEKLISAF